MKKKEYSHPQLECTEVTLGQFLCDSPVLEPGNQGNGGFAPARTLYV